MILISRQAGRVSDTSAHEGSKEGKASWWDLVEADMLDEELERGPSDHVPIYATLAWRRPTSEQA